MKYYGTVPALAWAIGHYFYKRKHLLNVAGEYYPYRLGNPKSSNPYKIYQDYYEPWRDRDDYDKSITQVRQNIRTGVIKKESESVIDAFIADRLRRICETVDITFFYPVVCRIDTEKNAVDPSRLVIPPSALPNSLEYVIGDLDDSEIEELLFLDYDADEDFKQLITQEYEEIKKGGTGRINPETALDILERRCGSIGIRPAVPKP